VAVVGRAVDASHPASAVARRLRGAGHEVVLVECGWPRGGADIETFGGSPAVARALVALCRGEVAP
jgi:beta-N-acetylhexosaminidase